MDQNPFLFLSIFERNKTYALSFLFLFSSFIALLNVIGPFQPQSLLQFRIGFLSEISSTTETCDYSYGKWIWDEGVPLQTYNEDCPFLDPGFKCQKNGRLHQDYLKWRWRPLGCDLPRFNASDMLERSRNARIVFAGDSMGRNQWESLLCMLSRAISNQSSIYEQNGNSITKHKGHLSILFSEYNLTVEYYRVPFLVTVGRPPTNSSHKIRSAIRVDELHWKSQKWAGANILVFNAGHWWTEDKLFKMGAYFQEGEVINMTMDMREAFRRSLQTWKQWVVSNLDPLKTHIFVRSFSPTHFRNGTWNDGGTCDNMKQPETNYSQLQMEPWQNMIIWRTIEEMKRYNIKVQFLNITYLTELRQDGHPSIHRELGTPLPLIQDCSHWCLPGVPDTWNLLLYTSLLTQGYNTVNYTIHT